MLLETFISEIKTFLIPVFTYKIFQRCRVLMVVLEDFISKICIDNIDI